MAWKFTSPLLNLLIKRGVIDGFSSTWACTIFPGSFPASAAYVSTNWDTIKSTYLIHWAGLSWTHPGSNTLNSGNICTASGYSSIAAASGSPTTATWGVLWTTNITSTALINTSMGASGGPPLSFVVCSVSTTEGTGVVRLNDTSIVSGGMYIPSLICIQVSFV